LQPTRFVPRYKNSCIGRLFNFFIYGESNSLFELQINGRRQSVQDVKAAILLFDDFIYEHAIPMKAVFTHGDARSGWPGGNIPVAGSKIDHKTEITIRNLRAIEHILYGQAGIDRIIAEGF
jgi:hypothetical protein